MFRYFFITLILVGQLSCAEAPEPAVPEVAGPESTNASLIRNPVASPDAAPQDSNQVARMVFEEPEYQFGEVREGTVVRHTFRFRNAGRQPLLITDARSTCGCTVPSYPEQPIAPGATGEVEVVFNTTHKYGRQRKPVTLTANTYPSLTTIYVDGTVINE